MNLNTNICFGFKPEIQFIFQFQFYVRKNFKTSGLTAESCWKPNTNNQQLLRNKLKLTLKYALNLRFETQVFNSQFPTRPNISFFRFPNFCPPQKDHFLVYFNKPSVFYLLLLISTTGLGVVLMDGVGVGVGFSTFRTFKIFSSPVGTNLIMELSISSLSSTSYKYLLTLVLEDALSILLFFGLFLLKLKLKTSLNSYSFSLTKVNVAMNGKLDFSG